MKIGISSWGYRKWFSEKKMDFLDFIEEVKRQGADGFEIGPGRVDPEDPVGHLKAIAAQARDLELGISALAAGNDFALPAIKDRATQVEQMLNWISAAAESGIERLNVFTGYHMPGEHPEMETARVIDCFREVMPVAEEREVTLCMENHSSVHPDADGLLWIIKQVGSPLLRTNPDPSNFCQHFDMLDEESKECIYTETEKIAPLMANSHLKICDFTPDGDHKHLDMGRILDIYREVGFDGFVVLEYYREGDPEEPNAKGVALLKKLLAE